MIGKERLEFWPVEQDAEGEDSELTLLHWNAVRMGATNAFWSDPSSRVNQYLHKLHEAAARVRSSAVASVATSVTAGVAAGLAGPAASLSAKAAANLTAPAQAYHLTIGGKLIK